MKVKDLFVYTSGGNKTKAIVFVHGYPFDHRMWDYQVEELSKNYKCVTYDIRGLGQSPESDGQFTMELFVDDLESVLIELGIEKAVLCGLSMGGYISLRAAERMENKFSALILCDTKSMADDDLGKLKRAAGIKTINEEGAEKFVEQFVPNCFSERFMKEENIEYLKVLKRSKQNGAVGLKGCLLAMAARTDTTAYLSKLSIPTLIICGKEDKIATIDVMKSMSEQIKDSRFIVVEDAGHMTPIEKAEIVTSTIREFLSNKVWP